MKQKIYLRFQAYNQKSVEEFKDNLVLFCQTHNIVFSSISLPIQKKKYTVLKSPHVNKKAKEQFEIRLYNGLIILEASFFGENLLQQIRNCFLTEILVKISFSN